MSETTTCESEQPIAYPQIVRVRAHTFRADLGVAGGGTDSAPGPHEYFDAALASCKALTALWFAKRHGIALERVETRVERDASKETAGTYHLTVHVELHGPMTDDERARVQAAIARCPIHKLMTTSDVVIDTV